MTSLFKTICNYFSPPQSIEDYCKAFIERHDGLIGYINQECKLTNTENKSNYKLINDNTALVYIFMIYKGFDVNNNTNQLIIKQTFFIYYENGTYKITPYNSNWD
jgi:hypothetical protein